MNLGTRKKSFEKARGNAEREEKKKEHNASREGPAGTLAQLCKPNHKHLKTLGTQFIETLKNFLKTSNKTKTDLPTPRFMTFCKNLGSDQIQVFNGVINSDPAN